ncbi:MAG: hypothetical protein QGI83_00885, partial [Candidatus Latescibacteria bacterium]|nr:hypothetical protein [Candidatus Latescibacterota bacterium]
SNEGGTGKVDLRMLRPTPDERSLEILSGEDASSVFGQYYTAPKPDRPEANGHRVMISPSEPRANDVFLTVMQMSEEGVPELPVDLVELPAAFVLTLADRAVVLSRTGALLEQGFEVEVKGEGERQLLVTGLTPGAWSIRSGDGEVEYNAQVKERRNTAFFVVPAGAYAIRPEAISGAAEYEAPEDIMPTM